MVHDAHSKRARQHAKRARPSALFRVKTAKWSARLATGARNRAHAKMSCLDGIASDQLVHHRHQQQQRQVVAFLNGSPLAISQRAISTSMATMFDAKVATSK